MRSFTIARVFLASLASVFLFGLLKPAFVFADEAHSWCFPGAAKTKGGSSDGRTNSVVAFVCGQSGFESCCTQRWNMSCVQKGMDYAKQSNWGDFCGRDAWTQGPLAGTGQRYPRDFNLFTLGYRNSPDAGNANGCTDV